MNTTILESSSKAGKLWRVQVGDVLTERGKRERVNLDRFPLISQWPGLAFNHDTAAQSSFLQS